MVIIIIIIIIIIIPFNICKEIGGGVKLDKHCLTTYQKRSQQVMNVRLPYYGTNKCELTTIPNNKPDIIMRDDNKGTSGLIT